MTEKVAAFAIGCAVVVTIVGLWTLLQALLLMVAWNLVIPMLFHAPSLTYGAALAISALLSIVAGFFRASFVPAKSSKDYLCPPLFPWSMWDGAVAPLLYHRDYRLSWAVSWLICRLYAMLPKTS